VYFSGLSVDAIVKHLTHEHLRKQSPANGLP